MDFAEKQLTNQLCEILTGSTGPTFDVRRHPGNDSDPRSSAAALSAVLTNDSPSLVFLAFSQPPDGSTLELLMSVLRRQCSGRPVILVTKAQNHGQLVRCFEHGVAEVILAPLKPVEVLAQAVRWIGGDSRNETNDTRAIKERLGLQQFIGESPAFLAPLQRIPIIARSNFNVLIQGETGTGKEIGARAIHHLSCRVSGEMKVEENRRFEIPFSSLGFSSRASF